MIAAIELPSHEKTGCLPTEPTTCDATGLGRGVLIDLILKTIYQHGPQPGVALADSMRLPLSTIQPLLSEQRRMHVLEVVGSDPTVLGEGAYVYSLTEEGDRRTQIALERNTYVGPAPVPFSDYAASVHSQSIHGVRVTETDLKAAFRDLILTSDLADEIGPAVNAGTSIFFFGAPGNGKTAIATRITRILGDAIYVPYAIEAEGSIIEFFDPVVHTPMEDENRRVDRRWLLIQRPTVVVGGELSMADLDLTYSTIRRTYEAPYQMKANCGMFLIDDFGRQQIRPEELLNRWIVPLESRIDFLRLQTGSKLEVPFDELIVFSTNLDPRDLADEAFLRRIKYKISVEDPTLPQFYAIFKRAAEAFDIEFNENGFRYLIETYYQKVGRPYRAVHPRDLLDQVVALARYKGLRPTMSKAMIDRVVRTYFARPGENI